MLKNRQGKMFHGEFIMYIFEDAQKKNLGIKAFQIAQEDFQTFTVTVVPEEGYGPSSEEYIVSQMRERFDADAVIKFRRVEQIERAASGKMRVIKGMGSQG